MITKKTQKGLDNFILIIAILLGFGILEYRYRTLTKYEMF